MEGFTVWFTGLSGSGKTTLSKLLQDKLLERGLRVEILDGDVIRDELNPGLGFSKDDRDYNIRRIGFVCHLLTRNGVVAISAAISPYDEMRKFNRKRIGRFIEVWCKCDLDTLITRDPKGLYERALGGEIKNFTGLDDPYEIPEDADVICDTANESIEQSLSKIIQKLEFLGYI